MLKSNSTHTESVGHFYDTNFEAFLSVYGDVFQAFRTKDVSILLDYEANSMELKPNMKVLDAGCGVCGPAIYFAAGYGVFIDAITASGYQAKLAAEKIMAENLTERITVQQGDYHKLEDYYEKEQYDVVYFLESFGHSDNKKLTINSAWNMLKPGGRLYIKDIFIKEAVIEQHEEIIMKNVQHINDCYCYHVSNLYDVLRLLRKKGFIFSFLKTIDIPLEDFENLAISNDFQELTGIYQIGEPDPDLFPVDFLELLCIKPWYEPGKGNNRYFLQNLYNMQVRGLSEDEL